MKMEKMWRAVLATLFVAVMHFAWLIVVTDAYGAETVPYTSMWGDFKTAVPDGWKASYGNESTHYTDTNFKSPEPYYSLSIRWYTRFSTHRLSDDTLEMYGGVDDYIKQITESLYRPRLVSREEYIEPVQDVTVDGKKAKRFVVRSPGFRDSVVARFGVHVGDEVSKKPGEHAYALLSSESGFYVLIYYAPQGGYDKYGKFYDQMVASFVRTKDGPGGIVIPGKTVAEVKPAETLERYVSMFKSNKDILLRGPASKQVLNERGDLVTKSLSGWFEDTSIQKVKEIIEFVSTMKPAPAIPEEARRNFVRATTFMKVAKTASDYKLAIDAYKEALLDAPWWGDAYFNLGMALEAAGLYDDAKESVKLYLLTKPGEADKNQAQKKIYEIEAKKEMILQRYQNFKEEANQGVRDYSRGPSGYDDAIRHWKKALELSPDEPEIHVVYYNLGETYANKGNVDEAYRYMQKAFELKPERPNAGQYNWFGVVLQRRGDRQGACQYYKKGCDAGNDMACSNYRNLRCP